MNQKISAAFRRLRPGKLGVVATTFTLGACLVVAGASTEAYHDQHSFGQNVSNDPTVNIQLSSDNNNDFVRTDVLASPVSGLEAGDVQHITGYVENAGEAQVTLDSVSLTATGAAFDGSLGANPDTATLDSSYVGTTIDPGQVVPISWTVTSPAAQDGDAYSDAQGSVNLAVDAVSSSHYVDPASQVTTITSQADFMTDIEAGGDYRVGFSGAEIPTGADVTPATALTLDLNGESVTVNGDISGSSADGGTDVIENSGTPEHTGAIPVASATEWQGQLDNASTPDDALSADESDATVTTTRSGAFPDLTLGAYTLSDVTLDVSGSGYLTLY